MLEACGTGVHTYVDNMSGCGTSSCFGDKCWKRQPGEILLKSMVKHFNVKGDGVMVIMVEPGKGRLCTVTSEYS